ncbi:11186_t:CDS:2, partial [Paraglomus occultum]
MSAIVSSHVDDLMSKILSDESALRVKDVENVRMKISRILEGGVNKLHVISDFDSTMSRHFREDMSRNPTCHQVLSSGSMLSPEFKQATAALYQKYFPIEMDTTLTVEEKVPYMVEWWSKAHELVIRQNLTKNDIKQMLLDTPTKLREGIAELIIQCKEKNIP